MLASCIGCKKVYDEDSRQRLLHRDCFILFKIAREMVANKPKKEKGLVANKHGKYSDLEKRRTYMREYMKEKRANQVSR